jgi:PKD repeat protein
LPYHNDYDLKVNMEVRMHPINKHKIFILSIFYFVLSVYPLSAANNPPVIQPISDQMGYRQTEIIIYVEDPENDTISLSAVSSDTNVIPQNNILITGVGANWILIITPTQIGSSAITVYADDNNGNEVSTSFIFQSYPIIKLPENVSTISGTVSIPLTLNNYSNEQVFGVDFTLDYDPLVIQVTDFQISETKLINNYLIEYNIGISGQIIVCIASNNEVYTGTGQIGTLFFDTITEGQTTSLSFSNARLNEWKGLTQGGMVTVLANQAPSISDIANVNTNEDTPISVFFTVIDPDSAHCSVNLDINSDNSLLVPSENMSYTCYNNTYTLVINPANNQYGSANFTISATDNHNISDTQNFTLEVSPVNDPPQISSIDNLTINEDTVSNTIYFNISDIETDASELDVYASSSNTNLIPVENIVFGGTNENRSFVITPTENQNGTATVTITVSDSIHTATTSFDITVSAVDDPPHVMNPINDVSLNEDSQDHIISLANVFTDVDNDDNSITISVVSNTNMSVVNVSISDNNLVLNLLENQSGVAAITIMASSNGQTVMDIFTVTVTAEDDPLQVVEPIEDVEVQEDALDITIDLSSVFSDVDNDNNAIVKTIQNNSNPDLVSANISNDILVLHFTPNLSGNGSISIRGTSNGKTADDIFTITVLPVDDAPYVLTAIDDIVLNEDDVDYHISLENTFSDIDTDDLLIVKTIQSNSNESLLNASISNDLLTLSLIANQNGSANIEILANANGLTAVAAFMITVTAIDDAPEVIHPVSDISVEEDSEDIYVDLSTVFHDIDNDDNAITKIIQNNSNPALLTTSLTENTLTLYFNNNQNGSATIVIQANSNGIAITDAFEITVESVDDAPHVNAEIEDVVVNENADDTLIPLTNVFVDIDNDPIIFSIESNTNESLVVATIVDHTLILNYQPHKSGVAIITIRGMANLLFDETSFIVTVISTDSPPEVSNPIPDVTVNENADNEIIPLTSVFSDQDNDDQAIEKIIFANSNESLVTAIIENNLLILTFIDDMNGSSTITIQATSNGKHVTNSFDIIVTPVDTAPRVKNPIHDLTVDEDALPISIPLTDVFTDIDNDDALIALSINNSNESLLSTSLHQNELHLELLPNMHGVAKISILATSNGLTVVDNFSVNVESVNDIPAMSILSDLTTYESLSVTQAFMVTDEDNQGLTLTVTVSNTQVLPYDNITFVGGERINSNQVAIKTDRSVEIQIMPASGKSGNVTITLIISDGIDHVEKSFILTVKKYFITAISQGNGQIVPSGIIEVNTNTPYITFQMQPEIGFKLDYLIVDNQTISARPTYTFRNIAEYHTITAIFREPAVYTISTHKNTGGIVKPDGFVQVTEGNSQTFEIQSQTGFDIDYLKVDGNYVVATSTYTFKNVNEMHSLEVFFKSVPAPVADFVVSGTDGIYPLVITFTDKSLNSITSRTWNFGDGTTNTLKNPQHTYFKPGKYTVSLQVKGPGGENTLIKKNLVNVFDLQVDYTATPASGAYPLTVAFAADMPDSVTHVLWSFGDGETSTSMSPTHIYMQAGSYTTRLTAYAGSASVTIVKTDQIMVKGRNISGRITASDTGSGLAGYQVEIIQRLYNHTVGETYTDDNGYYTFICEPSSVTCLTTLNQIPVATDLVVAVWPPAMHNDYYMQYYSGQSLLSKATPVSTKNGNLSNMDMILEKTLPLTISGKVHADGIVQKDIQISAYSEKLNFGLNVLTDENGIYTLSGLKASDDYRVSMWDNRQKAETYYAIPSNATPGISIPTYSVYNWDSATLVEPKASVLEHIDIVLDRSMNSRGLIQGQLKTENQAAPENIWVYAFSEVLNFGNGAFTDENGYYTITALSEVSHSDPLTMGYIVAVHSIQYNNQEENPSDVWYTYQAYPGVSDKSKALHVRTGSTGIDFMLITQCQITGTVMDIYNTPVPDAEVSVSSEKAGMDFSPAFTDMNGYYAFTGLPPVNDYVVTVTAPNYPITYYKDKSKKENADKVDLSYGSIGNIDIKLDTGMVIRGVVYMDNSNTTAPEGLWVNIWSKSTQTGSDVPTDINGRFQKSGLNPDASDYIISIRIENYMPAFYRDNKDSNSMNDTVYLAGDALGIAPSSLQWAVDRNLIMRTGLSISGKILHNGLLVSGIEIEAFSHKGWDNDISKGYLTDGHNYKLSGLPPGEYNVMIKPSNFQDDSYRVELVNEDVGNILFPLIDLETSISGTVYGLAFNHHAQIIAWAEERAINHVYSLFGTGYPIDYNIPVKPSADYQVKFTAGNGYPDQWYDGQTVEDQSTIISVSEGTVSGIDFHVSSGSKVISGTVNFPESATTGEIVWVDAHSNSTGSSGSAEVMLLHGKTANYKITGLKEASDFIVVAWGKRYQEQYYDGQTTEKNADRVNTEDEIPDDAINFDMNPGASISGTVYQDGNPATDLYIEAFSEMSSSFGGHTYIADGSYLIEGLDLASDYIIKVYKSGMAPFYYHTSGNTRDDSLATKVSTLDNKHVTGINIKTYRLESISGTVRDEEGKALSDIWVNVWSSLKKCGEGIYTGKDGTYKIDGLSKSNDYIVSIDEHADLIYVPEVKTNVKSNSSGVNFMLRKAFHLKGTVLDTSKAPIVKAQVELYSDLKDFDVWTSTDASGTFNIKCVPSSNDYVLSVMPFDDELAITDSLYYIKFNEAGLSIDSEHTTDNIMEKEIILKHGSYITGHIYKSDGRTPVKDAKISVYSDIKGKESSGNTTSDSEGFYRINNIPIAQDYIVTVTSEYYAKVSKIDQSTGTSVDFILDIGGSISGRVIEEEGAPLADILVSIVSDTATVSNSIRTDINGYFTFSGLPRYLDNGSDISDYVVKISPENYPTQSQGQKQIGESVVFVCKKGGELTGTITDSLGKPIPENVVVGVKVYHKVTQGGFETKAGVNTDSNFTIDSLLFNTDYQLKVIIVGSNLERVEQWIDANGMGVSGRNDAGLFKAGNHVSIRLNGVWNR